MLILARKVGEEIVIPDLNITIRVMEIDRGKVRLGFVADRSIAIYRKELLEDIRAHQHEIGGEG